MRCIFACLAVILGTIIGAGFASGKEIITFFNIYGDNGLIGIIIASILFGFITIITINTVNKKNITDYKALVNNNKLMPIILELFSLVCFCIMISGVGVFFEEQLNINYWLGTSIAASISYLMFLNRFNGLEIFSMLLVPFITIGILLLGVLNYEEISVVKNNIDSIGQNANFLISGILYASYNSLILVPILINFRKYKFQNNKIFLIGFLTTLILGILMLVIYKTNNIFYPDIVLQELPNMYLASLLGSKFKIAYGFIMLIAVFTTAFSSGFNFLEMRRKENYERNALIICILALVCSKIGFSNLINYCFPIFGYLRNFTNNTYNICKE